MIWKNNYTLTNNIFLHIQQSHKSFIDLYIKDIQQVKYQLSSYEKLIKLLLLETNILSNIQDLALQVNLRERIMVSL